MYTTIRVSSDHNSHTRFVFFFYLVVWNGTLLLLFVWWVWSFFSLLRPSLFLQCLKKHLRSIRTCPNGIQVLWYVCHTVSVLNTTTRVSSYVHLITILTRSVLLICGLKRYLTLSLVVFASAFAFNQDVSKWDTGAVIFMNSSKCTLSSLSLWPRLPLLCILNVRQNSSFIRISLLTRFVIFVFVLLVWVGLSFLRCTLSCSV